jgi:hypothetical protein
LVNKRLMKLNLWFMTGGSCRTAARASTLPDKAQSAAGIAENPLQICRAVQSLNGLSVALTSERRACQIVGADRKMGHYRSRRPPETELRARLRVANDRRRFGYRRLFVLLRREGEPSGINRINRLESESGAFGIIRLIAQTNVRAARDARA